MPHILPTRLIALAVTALLSVTAMVALPMASASASASSAPQATTVLKPARQAWVNCRVRQTPFWPTSIDLYGVGGDIPVLGIPRNRRTRVPGTPPISNYGKQVMAWSRSDAAPGSYWGNVLMNAHTWPDGSALGNRMLANLQVGSLIIVFGQNHHLCYRVTKRVVYKPRGKAMMRQYYSWKSRSQLAIVVCSGKRLGPGKWSQRTVWYASPSLG
ncbi:MAG: class F sortase [Nocardioidaceae bacterium]